MYLKQMEEEESKEVSMGVGTGISKRIGTGAGRE